jgi:hypothetical protein
MLRRQFLKMIGSLPIVSKLTPDEEDKEKFKVGDKVEVLRYPGAKPFIGIIHKIRKSKIKRMKMKKYDEVWESTPKEIEEYDDKEYYIVYKGKFPNMPGLTSIGTTVQLEWDKMRKV